MSKKEAKQPRPWKYYARDCRGRFIKKNKKTPEDLADGTERMYIEKPTWMYVQQDCEETNFKKYWRKHPIDVFKTKAALSLLPWLKTWKVLITGYLYRSELKDSPGIYHKDCSSRYDKIIIQYLDSELVPYEQVVALRQSSSSPLEVTTDYSEYNVGLANIGTNNVGLRNFGFYNKGVECMGIFNTDPACFYMFNKPCDKGLSAHELYTQFPYFLRGATVFPNWASPQKYIGPLKAFEEHKEDLDWPEQYKALISLPNFDFDIFEAVTGISKKMLDEANKEWEKKYGKKCK